MFLRRPRILLSALLAALCAAAPLHAQAAPTKDEALFPRYPELQPAVAFWTRVFGEFSENQTVIHSQVYPGKIFTVLDFRDEAQRLPPAALARLRAREEQRVKARVDDALRRVHKKRHAPETLSVEERQIYDLYADVTSDQKFIKAVGTARGQRGLKERTQQALEVSGKYLPEMEAIFKGYGLPLSLTRLPLVESSFNVEAYSKVGAAGLWQFIPSSARIYMRLNEVVDDRRDPWTSTDAAARHLRDDYAMLGSWPLALTAYNHGRGGVAAGLRKTGGTTLVDLVERYKSRSFGFASRNFYAEFLAAVDVERDYRNHFGEVQRRSPLRYEVVETKHYVPYETLRRLCNADDQLFQKLNPAYRPEVIAGKLYVPPGHLIRVPAGSAKRFEVGYASLGESERFDAQRVYFVLHKVRKGEVLGAIARRHRVSQQAILSANGLRKGSILRIGQVLKIPPHHESRPGPVTVAVGESKPQQTRAQKLAEVASGQARVHKVRSGQTLSSIAKRYQVSVQALREANDLGNSSLIKPGMRLRVPG